jgi:hypothetical protein
MHRRPPRRANLPESGLFFAATPVLDRPWQTRRIFPEILRFPCFNPAPMLHSLTRFVPTP